MRAAKIYRPEQRRKGRWKKRRPIRRCERRLLGIFRSRSFWYLGILTVRRDILRFFCSRSFSRFSKFNISNIVCFRRIQNFYVLWHSRTYNYGTKHSRFLLSPYTRPEFHSTFDFRLIRGQSVSKRPGSPSRFFPTKTHSHEARWSIYLSICWRHCRNTHRTFSLLFSFCPVHRGDREITSGKSVKPAR